jgi:hypothetical protein
MVSSIHAHLMSQYVQDRIEQAAVARAVERRAVRLPRIAWRRVFGRFAAPVPR